jgi:hypothetical protein
VDYAEDTSQTYGYDSYTNAFFAYKSVKVGASDTAYADISGTSTIANEVYFTTTNAAVATVSPSSASSTHQQVTFTGVSEGFAQGLAKLHDPAKDNVAANIGVYLYEQDSYTMAFVVVHEDDDDVQDFNVGKGKSNQIAIAPGLDMVLDTTTTSGDDTIVVSNVTTGPDGICQTTAHPQDDQIITVGQGKAYAVCVSPGANGKRDTIKSGNDEYFGESINAGWDGICDTTADHVDDLQTAPFSAGDLKTYLNDQVYNQAIVKWTTVTRESDCTCNWDLNCDDDVEYGGGSWSSEENVIKTNCDPGSYDEVVFVIPWYSNGRSGKALPGQKYSFVVAFPGWDSKWTTAHEMGHAKFSLPDLNLPNSTDSANLMWNESFVGGKRLRESQWQQIQP